MIENREIKVEQAREWLTTHANHPTVMEQLGDLLRAFKDHETAMKRMKRAIEESSHDTFAYENLAKIYKAEGDREKWRKTLDEALKKTPDQGLKHARMQVEIADELMAHGQAREAAALRRRGGGDVGWVGDAVRDTVSRGAGGVGRG